jgi:hypothetical protein
VSPRRKASPLPAPDSSGTPRIVCPACKSEISGDGSTLHLRSKDLEEMIEAAGSVEKFEEAIKLLETKLKAEKQENERLKAEAATKTKTGGSDNVGTVQQGQGKQPSRGSWW